MKVPLWRTVCAPVLILLLVATEISAGSLGLVGAGAILGKNDESEGTSAPLGSTKISSDRVIQVSKDDEHSSANSNDQSAVSEAIASATNSEVSVSRDQGKSSDVHKPYDEAGAKSRNSPLDRSGTIEENDYAFKGKIENSIPVPSKNIKLIESSDNIGNSDPRVAVIENTKSNVQEGVKDGYTFDTRLKGDVAKVTEDDDDDEGGWGAALETFLRGGGGGGGGGGVGSEGLVAAAGARLQRLLGAAVEVTAEVADVLAEVPRQILLLPIRLGFYPGLTRQQDEIPSLAPFPCEKAATAARATPGVPTSVHRLRPGDIRVVAALGDSLTAANGALAYTEDETRLNYRGVSAYGGGESTWRQYLTLPNILKEFNAKLLGYALGVGEAGAAEAVGAVPTAGGKAGFNLARNGALDDELLSQAKRLVAALHEHPYVDVHNDWKLVNLLAGGNDLCNEYCYSGGGEAGRHSPEGHANALRAAIDYLQEHLPRTFVNLVHVPNLLLLKEMRNVPIACHLKQLILCSCLFGGPESSKAESVARMLRGYWRAEREVASDPKYERDDFAVSLQPFFLGVQFPGDVATWFGDAPPLSYFAPDCFHFSQKGNALAANALWNNMMEPEGRKTLGWQPLLQRFLCPNESAPFLFTRTNSKLFLETGKQFP